MNRSWSWSHAIKKRELRAGATLMKSKSSEAGAMFMKRKTPESAQCSFYEGSVALVARSFPPCVWQRY